jgi:hypothetical protein
MGQPFFIKTGDRIDSRLRDPQGLRFAFETATFFMGRGNTLMLPYSFVQTLSVAGSSGLSYK